jgi:hypothetical protein
VYKGLILKKSLITPILLAMGLSGCMSMIQTTAMSARDAAPVPKERLVKYQEPDVKRTFPIYVTRDVGMLGGACYLELWVDDTKVGVFDTGETAKFYIEPGNHTLEVNWDQQGKGLCGMTSSPTYQVIRTREDRPKNAYRLTIIGDKPMVAVGN